jgi:hypothetical protein
VYLLVSQHRHLSSWHENQACPYKTVHTWAYSAYLWGSDRNSLPKWITNAPQSTWLSCWGTWKRFRVYIWQWI